MWKNYYIIVQFLYQDMCSHFASVLLFTLFKLNSMLSTSQIVVIIVTYIISITDSFVNKILSDQLLSLLVTHFRSLKRRVILDPRRALQDPWSMRNSERRSPTHKCWCASIRTHREWQPIDLLLSQAPPAG